MKKISNRFWRALSPEIRIRGSLMCGPKAPICSILVEIVPWVASSLSHHRKLKLKDCRCKCQQNWWISSNHKAKAWSGRALRITLLWGSGHPPFLFIHPLSNHMFNRLAIWTTLVTIPVEATGNEKERSRRVWLSREYWGETRKGTSGHIAIFHK